MIAIRMRLGVMLTLSLLLLSGLGFLLIDTILCETRYYDIVNHECTMVEVTKVRVIGRVLFETIGERRFIECEEFVRKHEEGLKPMASQLRMLGHDSEGERNYMPDSIARIADDSRKFSYIYERDQDVAVKLAEYLIYGSNYTLFTEVLNDAYATLHESKLK